MEEETDLNTNAGISNLASDQAPPLTSLGTKEPLLKRPLDIMLSALMMILSLPVSLSIALAIKLEDRGSVFYRQERWSRGREDPLPISIHRLRRLHGLLAAKKAQEAQEQSLTFTHFSPRPFWVKAIG